MERYNNNSNKSLRQHVSLFYCEEKSVQRQLRLILARSVKIVGFLGSQPLSSFLIVPQLGTLSLRPFALFNCLWKRHIMLDYKPRKSEALAAALGGASSVFFSLHLLSWEVEIILASQPNSTSRRSVADFTRLKSFSCALPLSVFTLSECFGALFCSPVSVFLEPRRS